MKNTKLQMFERRLSLAASGKETFFLWGAGPDFLTANFTPALLKT